MDKCIVNQTNSEISVTIYVAECSDAKLKIKETHTVDILPKQFEVVEYGSITNSFISGISVSYILDGIHISTSQKVETTDSEFCEAMNKNRFIEIKGVKTLEIQMVE